jgi:hypothetical protein
MRPSAAVRSTMRWARGALDPMVAHDDEAVARWLEGGARDGEAGTTRSPCARGSRRPHLREARLLGMADVLVAGADAARGLPARADRAARARE